MQVSFRVFQSRAPFMLMLLACVAFKLVSTAWVAFKLVFMACVTFSLLFIACVAFKLVLGVCRFQVSSHHMYHLKVCSHGICHLYISSPSCCSCRGSPSKFGFITFMACFDNQNKIIKAFIYASWLPSLYRLQSLLVLWYMPLLLWFLLPYIGSQGNCQHSESPLSLIFMVCVTL